MDNTFLHLFIDMASGMAASSETLMELNKQNGDEQGYKTSQFMRDDFMKLSEKLDAPEFTPTMLTKADYSKLLVAALVIKSQLEDKKANTEKTINFYRMKLIPQLGRINDEAQSDEEAQKLSEEFFSNN